MNRLYIFIILFFIVGCQSTPQTETGTIATDPESERLKASLDAAQSQADMNIASGKIAEFWDTKLASVETRISQSLDGDEQKAFNQSKLRWRDYRTQEVRFQSNFFEGGSIQPLIANETYSEITKHRVEELEDLWSSVEPR